MSAAETQTPARQPPWLIVAADDRASAAGAVEIAHFSEVDVLITGESDTDNELAALTAHARRRPRGRVAVALPVAPPRRAVPAGRADGADPWESEPFAVGGR